MTGNLGYTEIASGQNQKEVTANATFAIFDKAITEKLAIDLSSGNDTITSADFQQNIMFATSGNSVSRNLTVPAVKRSLFVVSNGGTAALSIIRGSTTIVLAAGSVGFFSTDGTTNGLTRIRDSARQNYSMSISGRPLASMNINIPINDAITFPAGLADSNFTIGVNPASTMTFTIYKNGVSKGTVAFSTLGAATVTFTADVTFAAADLLTITAPGSQDATGADVGLSFRGLLV